MQKPSYWSILTADVRYDQRLRPNEKLLFSEITALSNKYGFSNASNRYFAELYNTSVRTVSTWINDLKKCGYLKVVITKNGSHKKSRKMYPLTNPRRKFHGTHEKNFKGSHEKNFQWNSTRENSTSNNKTTTLRAKIVKDLQQLMVSINVFVAQDIDYWIKTYPPKLILRAIHQVGETNSSPRWVTTNVTNQLRRGCKTYQQKSNYSYKSKHQKSVYRDKGDVYRTAEYLAYKRTDDPFVQPNKDDIAKAKREIERK